MLCLITARSPEIFLSLTPRLGPTRALSRRPPPVDLRFAFTPQPTFRQAKRFDICKDAPPSKRDSLEMLFSNPASARYNCSPMKKREKYTMKDVARLAGVSTSTVSAVLYETVPVSEDRKQRVLRAMSALHYQPDEIARSLKKGRTRAIGVVVPDITNAFYPEVVRGVEEAALAHGYAVFLCDSQEDATRENDHLLALFSRRVDGVLLACCSDSNSYETLL